MVERSRLTPREFNALKSELDELVANRTLLAGRINDARTYDGSQSAEYAALRNMQVSQESRLRELQDTLVDLTIVEE